MLKRDLTPLPIMIETLDTLIGGRKPRGTFHDARLVDTKHRVDFTEMQFALDVGDPNATSVEVRELRRTGVLIIHGLHDWILDPPNVKLGSWLTSDGPIASLDTDLARQLVGRLAPDLLHYYMYFSGTNAFLYLACREMEFRWC